LEGNKIRFYYRKILGFLYLILSLVWINYKGISSLGLGDIFIAVSLIIIGISIMKYKKQNKPEPEDKNDN
jgi:uncharacterized membrane protein